MSSPASNATLPVLIAVAAPIGGFDGLYFHAFKFELYREPSARGEVVTHVLRGWIMSAGAYLLASYRPQGSWFLAGSPARPSRRWMARSRLGWYVTASRLQRAARS